MASLSSAAPASGSHESQDTAEACSSPTDRLIEDQWPPNVVVVGGGLAGLVAALKLAEAGCRVTLLEAAPYLGGKVTGFVDATTGEAKEHSMRVCMSHYTTLMGVLGRLRAVGSNFREDTEQGSNAPSSAAERLTPVSMDYLPDARSAPLRAWALFRHFGIAGDIVRFGWAVNHSYWLTDAHAIDMQDWYTSYGISSAVIDFANAVMGVWTGAKPRSRASTILGSLYLVLLSMFNAPSDASWQERALRFSALGGATNQLYVGYPTNTAIIEPIRRRLVELGVELRTGVRVESLCLQPHVAAASSCTHSAVKAGRTVVDSLKLTSEETGAAVEDLSLKADAYVLAVDTASAQRLYPLAFERAEAAEPELFLQVDGASTTACSAGEGGEWSVGCSFPLRRATDLPSFLQGCWSSPRMVLDSPWHITYSIVRRQDFLGDTGCSESNVLFPHAECTILITSSNFEEAPGRLFGKPALRCTPLELKLEYLEQIGIGGSELASTLAQEGSLGLGVEFVSRAERLAKPWKYEAFALGPEIDDAEGHCWASRALLFIETKSAPDVHTITPGCENLFLAGEYISSKYTTIKVPTMEKSAETGAMAAHFAMRWLQARQDVRSAESE
eukprot:TRINITY_DN46564_c0_g1_i1.p1 TRINITY_DN46564_c0_g1~~TRINITY_DN46564_c0_g1_i1.p1  ORF type:complete len:616 (+),score=107.70 TRINITY_DN46564_c0_g1_i1:130-1977(+)